MPKSTITASTSQKPKHKIKFERRRIEMKNSVKMKYERPEIDVCILDATDLITTSNGFAGEVDPLYDEGEE